MASIASKYESPKFKADPQALYDILCSAETVEMEGISSTLVLHQDGHVHERQVSESDLHIEEKDGALKIYVPHDDGARDACFNYTLPRRILSWIMAAPGSDEAPADTCGEPAVLAVTNVLNCILAAVPIILEKNGVPSVGEVEDILPPECDSADTPVTPRRLEHASRLLSQSLDTPSSVAITPGALSSPETGDASYITPLTDPGDYGSNGSRVLPFPTEPLFPASSEALDMTFDRLLGSAVTMAGRIAQRDYGVTDVTDALDNLSLQDDDVFVTTSLTYDILSRARQYTRIGVAGELFVSERRVFEASVIANRESANV